MSVRSRALHTDLAGPWLSANTIAFGLGCECVAVLQWATSDRFTAICVGVFAVFVTVALLIAAMLPAGLTRSRSSPWVEKLEHRTGVQVPMYAFECLFGAVLFFVFGAKMAASTYISEFMTDMHWHDRHARILIMTIWTTCTVSRILGVMEVASWSFDRVAPIIIRGVGCMTLAGCFALIFRIFQSSKIAFWVSIVGYFTTSGPMLGFTYDLTHRITQPSPDGTAVLK